MKVRGVGREEVRVGWNDLSETAEETHVVLKIKKKEREKRKEKKRGRRRGMSRDGRGRRLGSLR